ncbi:TetR family transcriptional regulator [Collinsella sp. CLA-AA-H302]|uniref:TetR/AcrR family transcriptional regulator n=1 Tax=Collinsella sp. CLA-AA-H302 TaxID=3136217 RepID=UPI0032C0AA3F
MTRNAERDKLEAERRKTQLIEAGFELFARYGIESVSLSAVAKKADVAASTMYKYFQNKASLAVAISARIWSDVWTTSREQQGADTLAQMDPYQLFELYANTIIGLYLERPQILRYSANYKTYIRRENVPEGMLGEHLDPLRPIAELFLGSCKAAATGTPVRTDVSPEKMFSFLALTMLTMAERYAQGLVWTEVPKGAHADDLVQLKNLLLIWMKGE